MDIQGLDPKWVKVLAALAACNLVPEPVATLLKAMLSVAFPS